MANIKKTTKQILTTALSPLYGSLNALYRKQNVAMFHTGRCGSTVLAKMLNQHPSIYWGGEVFEKYMKNEQKRGSDFVDRIIKKSSRRQVSAIYGFETKYLPQQHLSEVCINMTLEDYVTHLRKLGFNKFIVLQRENHLRRAISAEVGRKKKKRHARSEVKHATKVFIDMKAFRTGIRNEPLLDLFRGIDENYEILRDLLSPEETVFLSYEKDILNDPREAYLKICRFLDINDAHPKVELKRTNPFSYEELIENFDEVKAAMKDTEYSWMLDKER